MIPQEPGHGSWHFLFMQAWSKEQSELIIHSGLHVGGILMYSGKHEHVGWLLFILQILFGPQGDGRHGFSGLLTIRKKCYLIIIKNKLDIIFVCYF